MHKKIMSFLCATMFILCNLSVGSMAAGEPCISVGSASGFRGDVVQVPVTIEENTGFSAFTFQIEYDETFLELTEIKKGSVLKGGHIAWAPNTEAGYVTWCKSSNVYGDGDILLLSFRVLSVEEFKHSRISVTLSDGLSKNLSNENEQAVSCTWQSGYVDCRVGQLAVEETLTWGDDGKLHFNIQDVPESKVSMIAACYLHGRLVDLQLVQQNLMLGDQSIELKNKEEYDEVRLFFLDDKAYEPLVQVLKIMKGAS